MKLRMVRAENVRLAAVLNECKVRWKNLEKKVDEYELNRLAFLREIKRPK